MKRLLTTASAIATLAMPGLALAHAYQDQGAARPNHAAPAENSRPAERAAPPVRQNAPPAAPRPQRPDQRFIQQSRPATAPARQDARMAPDRSGQDYRIDQRQRFDAQPRATPGQNWNRDGRTQQDYRTDQRQRFDSRARETGRQVWNRNDRNWWRGRSDFEGYQGRRYGYWFTPGYGYYRVDPRWYGLSWQVGGYVPWAFRGYYVQDIYDYGLPPAPYGYAYVYLDNNIVLMSLATGQIVQVFPNLY
jgi:Ni/Co efflux regulator RcnB